MASLLACESFRTLRQASLSNLLNIVIRPLSVVYLQYKQPLDAITNELKAAGLEAQIFTPTGVSVRGTRLPALVLS